MQVDAGRSLAGLLFVVLPFKELDPKNRIELHVTHGLVGVGEAAADGPAMILRELFCCSFGPALRREGLGSGLITSS
ncbi:hypothetical protein GCM10007885_16730 [Methylobacterium gnaphalii]|nr:hypothetical protein GCM10007885_16730 [Methylobacterium gnaphalii]